MNKIRLACLPMFLLIGSVFSANAPTASKPLAVIPNPAIQKSIAQSAARRALHTKCDALYGKEIRTRTGDLRKQMMDLVEKERSLDNQKRQNSATVRERQETGKKLRLMDSLAYRDTSANKKQRRQEARAARLKAMEKFQSDERKMISDPDLVKIRQSITALRKQINDSIAVIVKKDQTCLECYIPKGARF